MEKYAFREFEAHYPDLFEAERRRLEGALGAEARIEHVGSTAVPGLGGKGILDIVVTLPEGRWKGARRELEETGYEFREKAGTSERLFFRTDHLEVDSMRRVHVHLTRPGGRDWREMTAFRDFLRAHPEKAREYEALKRRAVRKAKGEGEVYQAEKEAFIRRTSEKALEDKRTSRSA